MEPDNIWPSLLSSIFALLLEGPDIKNAIEMFMIFFLYWIISKNKTRLHFEKDLKHK